MAMNTFLKWFAIIGAVVWLGYEAYAHFAALAPGDVAYVDGNSLFKDGYYERAAGNYRTALEKNPAHLPAMRALANSYVQLKQYNRAMATIQGAIRLDPKFGGNYATRGIIYDHTAKYELAIADYEKSLKLDPEVADGMHWLDRLLYNVQERPPTVADRLTYLKAQMKLPASKRVLRVPEIDRKQRPYEQ